MEIYLMPHAIMDRVAGSPVGGLSLNRLLSAILLLVLFLVLPIPGALVHVPHVCLAQWLFGVPCPGCGVLRSMEHCVHGDWIGAWEANPGGIFVIIMLLLQVVLSSTELLCPHSSFTSQHVSRAAGGVVMAVLAGVWIGRIC